MSKPSVAAHATVIRDADPLLPPRLGSSRLSAGKTQTHETAPCE